MAREEHGRAGFKQVRLDQELVGYVREKVKTEYHKDFCVDEDGKWLLQGRKGRVHVISCWKPAHKLIRSSMQKCQE